MAVAKRGATKRAATKSHKATKRASKSTTKAAPKRRKDPEGGLTAAGRAYFAKTEGSHLRPGVRGAADTPEKMRRKGSFLRRHFANPRGPMTDERGEPTRLALSAHAWGEPVPKTMAAARRLAAKGARLLERYAVTKSTAKKSTATKSTAKKATAKKATARKSAARKSTAAKTTAPGRYTKPALRERVKARVLRGTKGGDAGQWTARKAQLVAHEYEAAGGGYRGTRRAADQQHIQHWDEG